MFLNERSRRYPSAPPEARPRLEARLERAAQHPLVVIVAAPGYGKTAALARLAYQDPRPAIWYRCTAHEPAGALPRHIAASLAGPFAIAGSAASNQSWDVVIELLEASGQPRLLLVDEVHNLGAPDRDALLQWVTTSLPPGWSAAVSSTTDLDQRDVTHALAEGHAVYLDESDLVLERSEVETLVTALNLPPDQAESAWQRAAGWPWGVITLLEGREPWLAEYFSAHVLEHLEPRLRRFLDACLILERLEPDACRAVSNLPQATSLLETLRSRHVFTRRSESGWLELLPLFRATLLTMLGRRRPSPLARLAERAARHFVHTGEPATALQTLVSVGEIHSALDLLRQIAPGAVARGDPSTLREWLSVFPLAAWGHEPWLLHYEAVVRRLQRDYVAAWEAQNSARDAFRAAATRDGEAYATAELGILACALKRPADAEQLLEQARNALGASDEFHHASVLSALADAYVALNRLREATQAGERAVALTASEIASPVARVHVRALQGLASVRLREGDFSQALEIVRRALDVGRDHPLDVETSSRTLMLLGVVRWVTGDLDMADEILASAAEVATRHALAGLKATIDAARVGVLTDLGRLDEADRLVSSAETVSEAMLTDRRSGLGWLRVLQNRTQEARALFREMLQQASLLGNAADVGRAKASLGVIALQQGSLDEAEQWLLDVARGFEQSGARYRLASVHLHLADLYHTRRDATRARRYLRWALDYAVGAESFDFFLWHPATVARMAVLALRESIHMEHVQALCVRRLGAAEVSYFLPLLSRAEPALQPIARGIVNVLLSREASLSMAGLEQCADEATRLRLTRGIVEGCLTPSGLVVLRHQYRLTWAETDVFVAYYLSDLAALAERGEPERQSLAHRLASSENTLRHHITSIRQKLGLGNGRGSASVFVWALTAGIATWPPGRQRSALP